MHKRVALFAWVVLFVTIFAMAVISGHIATLCHGQTLSKTSTCAQSEHKILFFRSYGYGRQGPEIYNSKFFSVLSDAGMDPEDVMLEYLDLNRNRDIEYRKRKKELILHQYLGKQIDLIVAVEQPALIFLLEELKDLAPGVPVMAINATVPANHLTSSHHFLQKTVNLDFKGTLERALELFPKTRRVVVVTGDAEQDLVVKTESQATADLWKDKLEFEYTDHMSMAEIQRRVANLPSQTIVIYRAINRDRTGQIFVPYNALLEITKVANAPVFGLYDNYVGATGVVGGSVYHIAQEAERAAFIALAIMEGSLHLSEPLKTLPSEGVPMFDWQQIKHWSGDVSRLPANSIFVKRPSTLWEQYKTIVISIAIVFFVMATLIALLFIQNRRRKVAETLARKSEERYRSLLENQTELVCRFIPDGTFTFVNDTYYNFFDKPKGELVGKKWHSLPANTDVEFIEEKLVQICPSHPTVIIENKVLSGKGEIRWVQFVNTGFFDNHGNLIEIQSVGRDISELKQMEESLRKNEELFRITFEQAAVGMSILSPSGVWLQINHRLCEILGYSRDELMKTNFRDITHPDHIDGDVERVRQMAAGVRNADSWEKRYIRKDGQVIWVRITTALSRSEDGTPQYFVTVTEDITEQVHQRQQILLLNRLYTVLSKVSQAVVRAVSPQPFFEESCRMIVEEGGLKLAWIGSVDKDTSRVVPVAFCGSAAAYVTGIKVYTDDRPEGRGPMGRSIREGRPVVYNDFLHNELAKPWSDRAASFGIKSAASFPIVSEGCIWGALIVYSDQVDFFSEPDTKLLEKVAIEIGFAIDNMERNIQREKAVAALKESEDQYRTLYENMAQGGFYQLADGSVLNPNAAALRIFGLTREVFQQRSSLDSVWDIIHEDGSLFPGEEHPSIMALKTGMPIKDVVAGIFNPQTQGRIWVIINAIPQFRNGEERAYRVFVNLHDITSLKNAEKEQEALQAQLIQAQKMEAIGTLAGGIAHDLNNILFPITGLSEMLLDEIPPGTPEYANLQQIHRSAMRGSELVKQILSFSRQSTPQKLPIRLQPILKEVMKLSRATIPANIEITSDIQSECGMVFADPTHIHQIVMNLITNAYHAVEKTGGTIHIALKEVVFDSDMISETSIKPKKYACIIVSDTGTGIDQALIHKIFEPYFTTKELGKGTGLGLSVVHGIVKQHGGEIRVSSQIGRGTTFQIYFPLLEDSTDTKTEFVPQEYPKGSENILLVDDEEPVAKMVQKMLERLGYQVIVRTSSPEALDAFKTNPSNFDLVISDRGMPNMTGEQLSRELIAIRPEIPIIICTGFSDENDEIRAREIGIKGFLKKPVATRDLAEIVRKFLDEVAGNALTTSSKENT